MSGCPTCGCTCKQPELSFKHIACASAACRKCRDTDVALVVSAYRDFHPRFRGGGPGTKEYRAIAERLADGFSVSELYAAIQGMHRTPHNQGMNDRGQKYLGLELCMRSGSQVTRFAEAPAAPAPMTKATTGTALMLAGLEAEIQAEEQAQLPPYKAALGPDAGTEDYIFYAADGGPHRRVQPQREGK